MRKLKFDERSRRAKVFYHTLQLKDVNSKKTLETMMDMNKSVLKICIDSIKLERPNINEKELLKELRKIYKVEYA